MQTLPIESTIHAPKEKGKKIKNTRAYPELTISGNMKKDHIPIRPCR